MGAGQPLMREVLSDKGRVGLEPFQVPIQTKVVQAPIVYTEKIIEKPIAKVIEKPIIPTTHLTDTSYKSSTKILSEKRDDNIMDKDAGCILNQPGQYAKTYEKGSTTMVQGE